MDAVASFPTPPIDEALAKALRTALAVLPGGGFSVTCDVTIGVQTVRTTVTVDRSASLQVGPLAGLKVGTVEVRGGS